MTDSNPFADLYDELHRDKPAEPALVIESPIGGVIKREPAPTVPAREPLEMSWPDEDPAPAVSGIDIPEHRVTKGTRPGFVEVHFSAKPPEEVRNLLKGARFRWARRNRCWYGKQTSLPAEFTV